MRLTLLRAFRFVFCLTIRFGFLLFAMGHPYIPGIPPVGGFSSSVGGSSGIGAGGGVSIACSDDFGFAIRLFVAFFTRDRAVFTTLFFPTLRAVRFPPLFFVDLFLDFAIASS